MRSYLGNELAKIYFAIGRAAAESEDIITEHENVTDEIYQSAYGYLASHLENVLVLAYQNNSDADIVAMETTTRRYMRDIEAYLTQSVSDMVAERRALSWLVDHPAV